MGVDTRGERSLTTRRTHRLASGPARIWSEDFPPCVSAKPRRFR